MEDRRSGGNLAKSNMYATRQQVAMIYNENTKVKPKAALVQGSSMPNDPGPTLHANNRRALGDIGNLVGALSARCTVSKDGLFEYIFQLDSLPQKSACRQACAQQAACAQEAALVDRPRTRRYGPTLFNNQLPPKPSATLPPLPTAEIPNTEASSENALSWGAKQRRTLATSKSREYWDMPNEISMASSSRIDETNPVPSATSSVSSKPAAAQVLRLKGLASGDTRGAPARKKQTLTAILTARSEAACGGFEVEMEEAEEPLPNIDEGDIGDQLAVVDYVEDIYDFYRKTEIQSCVAPDYMSRQADINEKMRAILIDWLIEVHLKFKLMPETLFLTTNLIDRYLACQGVLRKNLQLVGVTAMLVASKYEEIFAPEVQDFVFISDNAYTREQVLEMEKSLLNKLKFNLTVPTPYVFLVRFLKAAASTFEMEMLAFFLIELSLTEYPMVKYPPSLLAAAAVYTAQHTLKKDPCWNITLQSHTGYTDMHLRECANLMVSFHRRAGQGNLTVVHKKYSNAQFSSVAKLQPAIFQWEDCVNMID